METHMIDGERERLEALDALGIYRTPPEPEFDEIATLAAAICDVPMAAIGFVGSDQAALKARVGIPLDQIARDVSLCTATIEGDEHFIIDDTWAHPKLAGNPLVEREPGLRFYAGYPIRDPNGIRIGSLCVGDVVPRTLNAFQLSSMRALARQVEAQLQLRVRNQALTDEVLETHQAERRARELSNVDELTGLANRRSFKEQLAMARDHLSQPTTSIENQLMQAPARTTGSKLGLLLIDVDNFKVVNDSLGHQAGDELLKIIAQRLAEELRTTDSVGHLRRSDQRVVARMGGDEFCVLLPGLHGPENAVAIAERLRDCVRKPIQLPHGRQFVCRISIGVMITDKLEQGVPSEDLLANADVALYESKRAGRDTIRVFEPSMRSEAVQRLAIECDLRNVLMLNRDTQAPTTGLVLSTAPTSHSPEASTLPGVLTAMYQPIVKLSTDPAVDPTPTGFEALARWNHPTIGPIGPDRFIPIAEESGLIKPLGIHVMRRALKAFRSWQVQALEKPMDAPTAPRMANLNLSINVSVGQLNDDQFIDEVPGIIAEAGVSPGNIIFEITESVMKDPATIGRRLDTLREIGIGISLDDFGTGYSSLSCLHQFPFTGVKIDRAFVEVLTLKSSHVRVVEAIINLAHHLGMTVTAEGVENAEQLRLIRELGGDYIQGYYFSKPLRGDAVMPYLQRDRVAKRNAA